MITNETHSELRQQSLAELFDKVVSDLQAGTIVDWDQFARDNPQWVAEITELLPAIQAMVDLESSTGNASSAASEECPPIPNKGVVGDFRLLREVGRGGMGVVYEAEQVSLGRRVALKILPFAAIFDDRRIERFRNEAKMAATLKHENIVSVFAVGCERGIHYYAMEFVNGNSFAEIIQSISVGESRVDSPLDGNLETKATGTLSTCWSDNRKEYFRAAARLVAQIADALEHAHQEGIVHRDIKPSNILVDRDGKPWLTDLGLAQIACRSESHANR